MGIQSREIIRNQRLGEQYLKIKHDSGLNLLLCPMPDYAGAYALFGTNYGSIDTCFKTQHDEDFVEVPAGIAHYLEHKLFESEDLDAFARYAKTGASANAYTSFNRTCYLFSCAGDFSGSLEILLDFVTSPYFTEETVAKEQGIIGQEIRMYDDDPNWQVFFNLLRCMYKNHPVNIDIAGTVESIAQITPELLYRCYNTFYNLNNMVLSIAGNFDPEEVIRLCDKILKPAEEIKLESRPVEEPENVVEKRCQVALPVSLPLFCIGFKEHSIDGPGLAKDFVLRTILLEIIAGEASELYSRLYDAGLINAQFGAEVQTMRQLCAYIFEGESKDPDEVYRQLLEEIARFKKNGVDEASFERVRKAVYGRYVRSFESIEGVASAMLANSFDGLTLYDLCDATAAVTLEELNAVLKTQFAPERAAISIVNPVEG